MVVVVCVRVGGVVGQSPHMPQSAVEKRVNAD